MKKTIKTSEVVKAYNRIKDLGLAKVPMEGRFKVIRATRVLRPVATAFEEFQKDAAERLKPEGWDELQKHLNLEQQPRNADEENALEAYIAYERTLSECLQPELDKEVELEIAEPLGDGEIGGLVECNTLTVEQTILLQDVVGKD